MKHPAPVTKHHVIDTNVLLVASAAHPFSPFSDSHVPPHLREEVLKWLMAFQDDDSLGLVLDTDFRIYEEYRRKLTGQDLGLLIIDHCMKKAKFVKVQYDENKHGLVPPVLAPLDPSDRKLAAAALAGPIPTTLVNATDSDWLEVEEECGQAGLVVEHLLESWLREGHTCR